MSTILGVRAFNRSQHFNIGDKAANPSSTVLVNIDNKRVQRDIARHASIGALLQVQAPFFQNDDGTVDQGGRVTAPASGLVLNVGAINFTRGDGTTKGSGAAGTATVGTADVTNPRIDTVVVDTTAGTFSVIAGTATAGANAFNLTGKGTVPANRIVLAYVVVAANAANIAQANILDARP